MTVPADVRRLFFLMPVYLLLAGVPLAAQNSSEPTQQEDPLQRPWSKKSPHKTESAYKRWADEDVPYIITDAERNAFSLFKLTHYQFFPAFLPGFWHNGSCSGVLWT